MRPSIRILAGFAIGIVVCFTAATLAAISLAVAQKYYSARGIETPHLAREYKLGAIHATGADLILVGTSVAIGILGMTIWFLATRTSKADIAAFSGAGLITAADNKPASQKPRKSGEGRPSE